jgi:hypothetical protein
MTTMTDATPRLLADAMLGKLARWLRILGYDTLYMQDDDVSIAQRARAEGRIVLTRDHGLAERRGLRTLFINAQDLDAQLEEVVTALGRPVDAAPRCMLCNGKLRRIPVEVARSFVPAYVAQTHTLFHRCAECGKIYWQGTHWQGIARQLDEV